MRFLFRNKKGVSNVFGYLFSFAVASMVMISAVIMTKNIMDDRAAKVGNMEAQSVANKVADAIVEAMSVGQSMTDSDYRRTLDIPSDIAGLDYYIQVTDKFIYVNTTNGVISKSCPNYGAGSSNIGIVNGKIYSGSGSVNIILNKSDYVYKFDFGTGNITSHSPVESGYFAVTNTSSVGGSDPAWLDDSCKARIPILVENDSPENMVNTPVKVVLSPSNFDYSIANVTNISSSIVKSDLAFYDPSMQAIAKISVSPTTWNPSWFYTYYYTSNPPPNIYVAISELSGGYNNSHVDGNTVRLKVSGGTSGREAKGQWNSSTGTAIFNGKEALEMLEDGNHYLSSPSYNIVLHGLLKNGAEFSGSASISIKKPIYVEQISGNYHVIKDAVEGADDGSTIFVKKGTYTENNHIYIWGSPNRDLNIIGEDNELTIISTNQYPVLASYIDITSSAHVNIDSLTLTGGGDAIYVDSSSYINITNCEITSCAHGIKVLGSSYVDINNCTTQCSTGNWVIGDPPAGNGNGINIDNSNRVRITDCESYSNNNEKGDGFDISGSSYVILIHCSSNSNNGQGSLGINIKDSHDCKILDSSIYDNKGYGSDGIRIDVTPGSSNWCYNNLIKNCTISGNDNITGEGCGINFRGNGPRPAQGNPIGNNTAENCEIYENFIGVLIAGMGTPADSAASEYNNVANCNIHDNINEGVLIQEYTLGLCWHNNITYCNIFDNGLETLNDGVHLYATWYNNITYCNIFDNGDDGLQIGGSLTNITGVYWSQNNTVKYNNFYCNGKSNPAGCGVYIKAGGVAGLLGSNRNKINYNNFGYDYPLVKDCPDYNLRYAADDKNWVFADNKNNWDNNSWDNYDNSSYYYIPNSDGNNNYNNYDSNPRKQINPGRWPNPDYIIVNWTPPPATSITIKGIADTADSYVRERPIYSGTNYGNNPDIWVDPCYTWPLVLYRCRIFIKFDLSDIPPVQNIVSANLKIYYTDYTGNNPVNRIHQCCRVLDTWSEYSITWNNQPTFSSATSSITVGSINNWVTWDVKSDIEKFLVTKTQINRGWAIKDSTEDTADMYAAQYDSKETGGYFQPYLEIVYTPSSSDPGPHYHPRTIAQGVANVIDGGTVYVKKNVSGTQIKPYKEHITITKPLKLIGETRDTVIIDGSGNGNVIYVNEQNVFIDSLTIKNGTRGIYAYRSSFNPSNRINITNCKIYKNTKDGIYTALPNVNIKNCEINNSGLGICITTYSDRSSYNNKILNCNIHNNTGSTTGEGILINTTSGSDKQNRIANCSIKNNKIGVYLLSSTNKNVNTIENCSLNRNVECGIKFENAGASNRINTIKDCTITGTYSGTSKGIYVLGTSYSIIKRCDISENYRGIEISSYAEQNTIKNCVIHDNTNYSIRITSSSINNLIYNNKFINNNGEDKDAYDDSGNYWYNGYPYTSPGTGGNLWDKYDEPSEGAIDYKSGSNTPQTGAGSDSIADQPYNISGGGGSQDIYPWCKRPIEIPYYIDYWNPSGESVIFVNMSITNQTSKYIYLYYGSTKSAKNHSMAEISVFFDDFTGTNIDTSKWGMTSSETVLDGKGNLSLINWSCVVSKNEIIPHIGEPNEVLHAKTVNQSIYVVEAKINTSKSEADMLLLQPIVSGEFYCYWIIANAQPSIKKLSLIKLDDPTPDYEDIRDEVNITDLNRWIRLKAYIYQSWEKYNALSYTNQSYFLSITGNIYNFDSYADLGNVSNTNFTYKIDGNNWLYYPYAPQSDFFPGRRITLGSALWEEIFPNKVIVDWIRVMKAPVIPPTITIGAADSANYGWAPGNNVHSNNIMTKIPGTDNYNPFNPGPLLSDFNYGNKTQPGTFIIKNLPETIGYTIKITMGNASGKCNETTVYFGNNDTFDYYGRLTIPATATGEFETKSIPINYEGGYLKIRFTTPSTKGSWTVNAMTIEKGEKGVKIDY